MEPQIQAYLHTLARKLKLDPLAAKEVLRELQGHLEEKAKELEGSGLPQKEACRRAVDELGRADGIAQGMYSVHSRGTWRDVLLATLPHLLLAVLFALHLWTRYLLVAVLLVAVTCIAFKAWRSGRPRWSYSWLGYSLAAPAISWFMALVALGYAGWSFVTTGTIPFGIPLLILIAVYIPFSLWITANVAFRVVRQDWLLASLTALPVPFLTSWVLFLNWEGGLWAASSARVQETDGSRALVFLALAFITATFLKTGHRLVQIGLLTVTTAFLVAYTVFNIPVTFSAVAVIFITIASVAFLLSPAVLESRLARQGVDYPTASQKGESVTHWFTSAG